MRKRCRKFKNFDFVFKIIALYAIIKKAIIKNKIVKKEGELCQKVLFMSVQQQLTDLTKFNLIFIAKTKLY